MRRWLKRSRQASDLETIAAELAWPRGPHRSLSVARSIYFRLPDDARLWHLADEFVPLRRAELTEAFSSVA